MDLEIEALSEPILLGDNIEYTPRESIRFDGISVFLDDNMIWYEDFDVARYLVYGDRLQISFTMMLDYLNMMFGRIEDMYVRLYRYHTPARSGEPVDDNQQERIDWPTEGF